MRNGVLSVQQQQRSDLFLVRSRKKSPFFLFQNPTCCAARWHSASYVASRTRLPQACAGSMGAAPVRTTKVLLVIGLSASCFSNSEVYACVRALDAKPLRRALSIVQRVLHIVYTAACKDVAMNAAFNHAFFFVLSPPPPRWRLASPCARSTATRPRW